MSAPIGNNFWELRSSHGRKTLFEDHIKMWEAACEYFLWCNDNPIEDPRSFGQRKIQRPYTMQGLCRYLDASTAYFRQFKLESKEGEREDFLSVITRIEETVYQQKFENAAIGVYNQSIIARDLGLREQSEITGADGAPLIPFKITGLEIK